MHDSVAHSQMKGTFSTSLYLPAAVAIFSFASLNVESLRAISSSRDCMPQLIHLRRQEKTPARNGVHDEKVSVTPLGVGPSSRKRRWRTANGLGRGGPQPPT